MRAEVAPLRESLVATWVLTRIWLEPSMSPNMGPQIKVQAESLPTDLALIVLFLSMH